MAKSPFPKVDPTDIKRDDIAQKPASPFAREASKEKGASPAPSKPASIMNKVVPKAAPPNKPGSVFKDEHAELRAIVKDQVVKAGISADEQDRVMRIALGLIPPSYDRIAEFASDALEEASKLNDVIVRESLQLAQLNLDDWIAEVNEHLRPKQEKSFLGSLFNKDEPAKLDMDVIQNRIKVVIATLRKERQQLVDMKDQLEAATKRLLHYTVAIASARLANMLGDDSLERVATNRQSLLDAATRTAALNPVQRQQLEERVDSFIETLDQLLYIAIPNFLSLQSKQVPRRP